MKKSTTDIIGNWLIENGNPEIEKAVKHNLALASIINRTLKEKGIGKKEFAEKMGKRPSEVSKWLSGTHNLTVKTIAKIEVALGIELLNIEKKIHYVYLGTIKGDSLEKVKDKYEKSMPAYAS